MHFGILMSDASPLKITPLNSLHRTLGAKMVGFGGYDMPVQYSNGILQEHLHVRQAAGLFDVSHMGQIHLQGPNVAAALEKLVPADIQSLKPHQSRYTMFTTPEGGIIDDLMVTKLADDQLALVVNAGGKIEDEAHLRAKLPAGIMVTALTEQALIAVQGPMAVTILGHYLPSIHTMEFMTGRAAILCDVPVYLTRSGYTGEDGFEISIPNDSLEIIAQTLLKHSDLWPIGLGARDSLRLEAGLCLYGHDIDSQTSPVEADLHWSIGKRRRLEGGFAGDTVILRQINNFPDRVRVGILPKEKAPAREGTVIQDQMGKDVGMVTSGGFSPSLNQPIAMGYVPRALSQPGTPLVLMVRGRPLNAEIVALPFVSHRYYRHPKP